MSIQLYIHLLMPSGRHSQPPRLPCACATLRRASRAVTQLYDEALRESGVRTTQYTLLQALALSGELTQGGLGELLVLESSTLSRTLLLLEKRGWIRNVPGDDRRERHLRLTTKGRSKLEGAQPHWKKAQDRLRKALGTKEWDGVLPLLDRITEAAQ